MFRSRPGLACGQAFFRGLGPASPQPIWKIFQSADFFADLAVWAETDG
jgi:hypothetical protein